MTAFPERIDHTVLGVETTRDDAIRVVEQAQDYGMNACIPPCFVESIQTDVTIATVIGFPHGQHTTHTKRAEAIEAYENGCDELDMVLNVGALRANEWRTVERDIAAVVSAVPIPVKVIIETAVLSDDETHRACAIAADAGAAYVKTSTGFADHGATIDDVELMSEYLPVKASGGIGSYERATAMLDAGADRIGASSGVKIVEAYLATVQE